MRTAEKPPIITWFTVFVIIALNVIYGLVRLVE
jgi:hypothetical protein